MSAITNAVHSYPHLVDTIAIQKTEILKLHGKLNETYNAMVHNNDVHVNHQSNDGSEAKQMYHMLNLKHNDIINKMNTLNIEYDVIFAEHELCKTYNIELNGKLQKILKYVQREFPMNDRDNIDDIINEIDKNISYFREQINESSREINNLRRAITILESSTSEREKRLIELIESVNRNLSLQIDNIDAELVLYGDEENGNAMNNKKYEIKPADLQNYLRIQNYDLSTDYNKKYIPFLRLIAEQLGNDDFTDDTISFDVNDKLKYHAYIFFIQQLLGIYSLNYIRGYLERIYIECQKAVNTPQNLLQIPALVLPQTLQTNSLYYLMNRYNTKVYEPDNVVDFGDFLFNFVKPEFRPDTTLALNLFQANIGRRYDSILIYSEETMKKLRTLRDTLSKILN